MGEVDKKISKRKRFWVWLFVIILILVLLYFFTYYLSGKNNKVIYQDATRRIYLIERKDYGKPGREMWNLVYEDIKTNQRHYILGNSKKGFPNKKMAQIILNTVDKGRKASFDTVQGAGVTLTQSKTDIHTNLIEKKSFADFFPDEKDLKTIFPV